VTAPVFVDTWAWIAAAVADDPDHARVVTLVTALRAAGTARVTSNFVLAEALTRLRYDASLTIACSLAEAIPTMVAAGSLDVVVVDDPIWRQALVWFRQFADQRFSFVDCTSFAIMAQRGLHEAMTADRHFATAGFVPLGLT